MKGFHTRISFVHYANQQIEHILTAVVSTNTLQYIRFLLVPKSILILQLIAVMFCHCHTSLPTIVVFRNMGVSAKW